MPYTTLLSAQELNRHLDDPNWVIIDCHFDLNDTQAGRRHYQAAHIPGAVYAHLDEDLSGPATPMNGGRHPLPDIDTFTNTLSAWGIDSTKQVIVYDDAKGAMAGRLWWMLRWLGHHAVAVLDGALSAWMDAKYELSEHPEQPRKARFTPRQRPEMIAPVSEVEDNLISKQLLVLDARMPERFSGEYEPIDPVGGHIPGAINHPLIKNVDADSKFLSPDRLANMYQKVLGDQSASQVVCMCGSGVTACHNLLAMEAAGIKGARLYPGSWSEWVSNTSRPVATGH